MLAFQFPYAFSSKGNAELKEACITIFVSSLESILVVIWYIFFKKQVTRVYFVSTVSATVDYAASFLRMEKLLFSCAGKRQKIIHCVVCIIFTSFKISPGLVAALAAEKWACAREERAWSTEKCPESLGAGPEWACPDEVTRTRRACSSIRYIARGRRSSRQLPSI